MNRILHNCSNHTKSLVLVTLLLLVANTLWANSDAVYEKVRVSARVNGTTSMAGLVYVSNKEENEEKIAYTNQKDLTIESTNYLGLYTPPVTVYLYVKEEGITDAVWIGWYNDAGALLQSGASDISVAIKPTQTSSPSNATLKYTAVWLQPTVEGDANGAESMLDLGVIKEYAQDLVVSQTQEYSISNYSKIEHFKLRDTDPINGFTITLDDVTEADADHKGNATMTVSYKATGIHGEKSGTTYLASTLYNGNYDGTSDFYKALHFKVKEDYTPEFKVTHDANSNALAVGTTSVGGMRTITLDANEVKDKNYAASAPMYSGFGRQQSTTVWKTYVEGEESGYEGLFTIVENPNSPTPTIQFNADAEKFKNLHEGASKTLTAELKVYCTYYDESNPAAAVEMPAPKTIYLSATVVQSNSATLLFGDNTDNPTTEVDLDTLSIGTNKNFKIPFIALNIKDMQTPIIEGEHKDFFDASISGSNVVVSIKKDASIPCGDISARITIRGTSTVDGETIKEASVNVSAEMYLGAPSVEAIGGDRKITFQWEPVFGATSYIVYKNANATQVQDTIEGTKYEEIVINNGDTRTYWFVAKNIHGCTSTIIGPVTGKAELQYITKANAAATGLKTGTAKTGNNFPWKAQRDIDVSAAFDAGGNPLFDELHIFALTTGTTTNNLLTPCLKYTKDAAEKRYVKFGDAIEETKSNNSKNSIYNFTDIKGNKKIYITGYRPYAATGTQIDEGVLLFQGYGGAVLDLYLDNCEVHANSKIGNTIAAGDSVKSDGYFADGSGAVFAIQSKSTNIAFPFNVNIHLKGSNILDATSGSKIELEVEEKGQGITDKNITHNCSPISVVAISAEDVVSLTIDDIWPTIAHANGSLNIKDNLNSDSNKPFASIDLGNSKTKLKLNGGQVHFSDVAACYQTTTYSYNIDGTKMTIYAYGIGTTNNSYNNSIAKRVCEEISIKDGTLNGPNTGVGFYANRLLIDGGTYNVTPKHFTAQGKEQSNLYNSDQKELGIFTVDNTTSNKYWTIDDTYGYADLAEKFSSMVDDLFPRAGVDGEFVNGSYHYPLSTYYVDGKSYGHASLCPNNNEVNLYLPKLNCQGVHFAWQICAPDIHINVAGRKFMMHDQVTDACPNHTDQDHTSHKYVTDYLLYMQADQYVMDVMGDEYFRPMNLGYGEIKIDKAEEAKMAPSIDIANNYEIKKKVYMLMPIEAAKWTLFAAPFDVANVYIIESYPETQLIKDYGGKRGKLPDANVPAARWAQAQRMVDLYTMWYFEGKGLDGVYDFFGDGSSDHDGDGSPDIYGKFVTDWLAYEKNVNYQQTTTGDYTPVIEKLIHYTGKTGTYPEGKTWYDANYYLYRANEWTLNEDGNFRTNWDVVTVHGGSIMQKGGVYALHFPYNSINGTHNPSATWDYWTGKYVLIESTIGPHTIEGSNSSTSTLKEASSSAKSGTATLSGNASFAEVTITNPVATMWTLDKIAVGEEDDETSRDIHEMIQKSTATIAPAQAVLFANVPAPANMRARTINYQTGEVTYEAIDEEEDTNNPGVGTGIPTIMGDVSLLVVPTEDGLNLIPREAQQVMIFTADGKMLFNKYLSAEEHINVPTGVYIVRGEKEQVKAIKK